MNSAAVLRGCSSDHCQEQFLSESQGSDEKHPFGPRDDRAVLITCCPSSLCGFNFRGECLSGVDGDRATPLDAQPFLCACSSFSGTGLEQVLPPRCWLSGQIHDSQVTDQSNSPSLGHPEKGALETGHTLNGSGKFPPLTPSENLEKTSNMREVHGPTGVHSSFVIPESWGEFLRIGKRESLADAEIPALAIT